MQFRKQIYRWTDSLQEPVLSTPDCEKSRDKQAATKKLCFCSYVTTLSVILMSVSTGRRQPTTADAARSLWSERDVSTQQSGLHATGSSQGVVTTAVGGGGRRQDTSVTEGSQQNQRFNVSTQTETIKTSNHFVSHKNIAEFGKHSSETVTDIANCKPKVDIKTDTYMHDLPVVMLSDNVGYVTSPGFDENQNYPNKYDGAFNVNVAGTESVLIKLIIYGSQYCKFNPDYVGIYKTVQKKIMCFRGWSRKIQTHVFSESLRITFHSGCAYTHEGFKIMFAILPRSQEPQQLTNKLFNCSVPNFHRFSPMFNCNMQTECEGGEDEQDCGNIYCGMEDTIDTNTKCYSLVYNRTSIMWFDAHDECIRRGQKLATFASSKEIKKFIKHIPPVEDMRYVFVGAQLMERLHPVSIKALYRHIWQWVDGRTLFSPYINDYNTEGFCALYTLWYRRLETSSCYSIFKKPGFVCEVSIHSENLINRTLAKGRRNVYFPPTKLVWNMGVNQCPLGHVTRDFLSCDSLTDCNLSYSSMCSASGVTVPMFVCQRSRSAVPYTLVCDHMQHCPDNADEDFCKHSDCDSNSIQCQNGQCFHFYQRCDGHLDCYDGSDELCQPDKYGSGATWPQGSIYLDGRGFFRVERMNDSDQCPPTHFRCPRDFCLPVYLRCNGVDDCSGREDEEGCDTYRCTGFYRCRGSKVCLHADNVCDDVPQCPEHDDELLCDLVCPDECRCQGIAFVCTSNFSASSNISLRYLDASNTNMTLTDVRDNIYLIALRLSKCHIVSLPLDMTFPNLRELDLGWNELIRLHMQHFAQLKNLKILIVTGNPLGTFSNSGSLGSVKSSLERIDLSHTSLEVLSGDTFSCCPYAKVLNLSWSKQTLISENSFQSTPRLENIDLRGLHLTYIPKNMLRHLRSLKVVRAENYKLCCEVMLPADFHLKNCHATREFISSCDDLLRSNTYRVCLWTFASLSLVGNMFSGGARLYQHQKSGALGSFGVFVTSLSVADLFMGVYLAIVGAADVVYRGQYVWRDDEWKNSVACIMAGFLCLLSSETSAFIICLITLDRFLVLKFPFGRLHFGRRSALVASGAVWVVGFALAIIPLLPVTTHWEFYSQTGICIPLPFTTSDFFRGYDYSFGVSILLNMVLFLLIAVGQVVIYWAVRSNSMPSITNTQTRDAAIARRLITVVVSDFLCWFPIGLLGLLASTGTPIPGDLNVAVAIFVLPVNSALNPFLYTFNLIMEKRRKGQQAQWLKRLAAE